MYLKGTKKMTNESIKAIKQLRGIERLKAIRALSSEERQVYFESCPRVQQPQPVLIIEENVSPQWRRILGVI